MNSILSGGETGNNNHFSFELLTETADKFFVVRNGRLKAERGGNLGTARNNVHFCLGVPEAGGGRLRTKSLDNVLSHVLVQQHYGHPLLKRPSQQSIVLPFHDGEE